MNLALLRQQATKRVIRKQMANNERGYPANYINQAGITQRISFVDAEPFSSRDLKQVREIIKLRTQAGDAYYDVLTRGGKHRWRIDLKTGEVLFVVTDTTSKSALRRSAKNKFRHFGHNPFVK